ncbi:MAG: 1,4-dihydroxy-2-naphthoate polyprenyltransferase [Bernardetiaceae bacterium]
MKHWIEAFRLRTLPLAWACIGMGGILAQQLLSPSFGLILLTATLLQILSNLANDYGDFKSGVDGKERVGPQRTVQAGKITAGAMRQMMVVFAILSLVSGLSLLWLTTRHDGRAFLIFLGLGLAAIAAAITYTVGKRPYGYVGLGDLSVMLFFGWIGVGGTYFLLTLSWEWLILLPATTCGALATGVLNLNNIRDIEADRRTGKRSLPVRMGRPLAVGYHHGLLLLAVAATGGYLWLTHASVSGWLPLLASPLLLRNALAVQRIHDPKGLDPYLKQLALTTLLWVILFGIGQQHFF